MSDFPAAIGILETYGYTVLFCATDRMIKAANEQVIVTPANG